MIDAAESAVRNDIERLLAAIIGMRAPADVAKQTRRVTQPAFLARLIEPRGHHETVGPCDQLLAVARRARAQLVEMARRLDQRVLLLIPALEHRIEQPLAHTEG